MAYCAHCGSERPETAAFCGKCGTPGGASVSATAPVSPAAPAAVNAGGFVSSRIISTFVLAFLVPVVGLILSINGKKDARAAGATADALNRIAFIVSVVYTSVIAAYIVVLIIAGIVAAAAYNSYSSY
jgi:uncharacterized membrane protein YvbJ